MILYQYKCPECNKVFEAMSVVEKRSQHPCPECKTMAKKTVGGSTADALFKPGWFDNIAPVPVYIENPKQFSNVAAMMGNYANRPFCRTDNGNIRQPRTKYEKRRVVERLKRGDY